MRIAVCDDELKEQNQMEKALREWDPTRSVEKFSSGTALLEAAKKDPPFDIVFLDIYLPNENGVEIAGALRELSPETGIVFVTTSREHAIDAFALDALHYLAKPVTTEGIIASFRRLTELRARQQETISLSVGSEIYTVHLSQICALESANHAVWVGLLDGRRLKTWTPLSKLEQQLGKRFLKINRGIVVNMDHIERMGTADCSLKNGSRFFLSTRECSAIRALYNEYLLSRLSRRGDSEGVEL